MNPSKGIYGGIGAAVVWIVFSNYKLLKSPHLLRSYTQICKLKIDQDTIAIKYLHTSACSHTLFLYKVLHLSVPILVCLSFSQENRHHAGKPIQKYRFRQGTPVYRYLPL